MTNLIIGTFLIFAGIYMAFALATTLAIIGGVVAIFVGLGIVYRDVYDEPLS